MISANASIQGDYLSTPDFPPLGERWRSSHFSRSELIDTACGDMRLLALGVYRITSTAATASEAWTITYDGVQIPFTTGATVNLTATAIYTALLAVFGPGKALEEDVIATSGVVVDGDDVTLSFADGTNHTIALVPPGGAASTFTAAYTTTPSQPVNHKPGYWVAYDTSGFDPQVTRIKQLDATTDHVIGGVVLEGAVAEDYHVIDPDLLAGPVWIAGRPMAVMKRGQLVMKAAVEILAADVGSPVYAVATGTLKGQCAKAGGGARQVTRGDVVFNGTDAVGLIVDALPTLSVASNTSDDQTATDLRDKWNASAQHAAVATATIDTSGSESYIFLTFVDYAAHTVTAYSPATADVTGITNTVTASAQTAILTKSTFLTPAAAGDRVAVALMEG